MGVDGLLKLLEVSKITEHIHISKLTEKSVVSVAVDAYGWLHKGVFAVADKLATGQNTDGYASFTKSQTISGFPSVH